MFSFSVSLYFMDKMQLFFNYFLFILHTVHSFPFVFSSYSLFLPSPSIFPSLHALLMPLHSESSRPPTGVNNTWHIKKMSLVLYVDFMKHNVAEVIYYF